jgi:serine/threonine protein kinase
MIGQTLHPYRITAALGAGGMGEVYRATDTTLGRGVALKVLPAEMASDPERFARFQREAQLLASLNHPNIAAIYGEPPAAGRSWRWPARRDREWWSLAEATGSRG